MSNFLKCGTVGLSRDEAWESEKGRMILRVARDSVLQCELRYGSPEQNPWISAGLGSVLASAGIVLFQHGVALFRGQLTHVHPRYEIALIMIFGLGIWLLVRAAFRKRYFLRMATESAVIRLVFEDTSDLREIRRFIAEADEKFGWKILDGVCQNQPAAMNEAIDG